MSPAPISPLVTFIRAQLPIAALLPDGVRLDHATLCALLEAHDTWATEHLETPDHGAVLDADVAAVAARFKRSVSWVYLQLREDRFPGAYQDRRGAYRFPLASIDAFIAAERIGAPREPFSGQASASGVATVPRKQPFSATPLRRERTTAAVATPVASATPPANDAEPPTERATTDTTATATEAPTAAAPKPVAVATSAAPDPSPLPRRAPSARSPKSAVSARTTMTGTDTKKLTWNSWRGAL